MSDTIQLTDTMFAKGRQAIDTKGWDAWLAAAEMVTGGTPEAIEATVRARIATVAESEAIAAMSITADKTKLNASITALAKEASEKGLILSITYADEKATLSIGKARKARSTDGKVGTGSRKSAFVAAEEGKAKGDTFSIVKAEKGYKDGDRFIPRGKLAGYLLKVYPTSKTAAILLRYGYKAS